MNRFNQASMQAQHDKVFSVAAAIPVHCYQAIRSQLDLLLETGALLPMCADLRNTLEESA